MMMTLEMGNGEAASMSAVVVVASLVMNDDVDVINDVVLLSSCGAAVERVACCVGVVTESVESRLSLVEVVSTNDNNTYA